MGDFQVSHDFQAVEDVLLPHLPTYWQHLLAVMEGVSYASAQRKADAFQVKGAIQVRVHYLSPNSCCYFKFLFFSCSFIVYRC